jgi:arylformamidase
MRLDSPDIIDISPPIHSGIAVFPGDTPFEQTFLRRVENGDGYTLSKITSTVHLGAHTDAPSHYATNGQSIEKRKLGRYLGASQVIEVKGARGRRITPADLKEKTITAPRVLFKTLSFPNPDHWNEDFAALSADLIRLLAKSGVHLVGIDTPSIDPAEDTKLESHHAVYENDMAILEGIVLDRVEEGLYQLIALPLPIRGADATPVRAVLLR